MRLFRMGVLLGAAIGYVLGARAGRQRYEQIRRVAKQAWESEPAGRIRAEVADKVPDAMTGMVHKISSMRHHNGDREMIAGAGRLPA